MKDLLFIAYNFPPAQNGAVARFWAYYKYLKEFGYNPVIVTVDNFGKLESEENVFRYPSLVTIMERPKYKRYFYKHTKKLFYDKFDETFDFRWRYELKRNIGQIIKEHKFDAVIGSFPRSESTYSALKISQKYNIPLITEFRDGYAFESIITKAKKFSKNYIKTFEEKLVRSSKIVITVTDTLTEYFQKQYDINNAHTVLNGYENDDFSDVASVEERLTDKKIRIVNFGSIDISGNRDVSFLYLGLERLKYKGLINSDNFELSLIGRYSDKEKKFINDLNLADVVKIYPPVNKIEGFKLIKEKYNYLLLYGLPGITHNIPSKTFEYIKLEKPILGICEGNESAKIINTTGTGETCEFSVDAVSKLFEKAIQKNVKFKPKDSEIEKYSRYNQVKRFADILKEYGI